MIKLKPIELGQLHIETPIALGPMAGVSDFPYRTICREMGAGMFYTELVSAKALHYRNRNTKPIIHTSPEDFPVGVQLFGNDPDILAEEALKLEDRFDFVDFNMGCPMEKIVANREGSALLKEPELVEKILKKLVNTVHIPVTVKIRKGYHEGETQGLLISKIAEDCGVSLIAVHGRVRDAFFSGEVDRAFIRSVVESVSIPVIGNGDIKDPESADAMLSKTGCAGIMIAQAAMGNPWIFREMKAWSLGEPLPERPDFEEVKAMILRHARMLIEEKPHTGILEMRKHAAWYLKGYPGATHLRAAVSSVSTWDELRKLLEEV